MITEPEVQASATTRAGVLYVIATPLGNLEDITQRALRHLREADLIFAEDTRRTRVLLEAFGLQKETRSLHTHNEAHRSDELVDLLAAGRQLALVTDAGTPAVSDPGAIAVERVHQAGY